MRLIDAETLNKELNDLPYGIRGIIKTMVHKQPAIDIVECKDCKYMSTEGKTTKYDYCNLYKASVNETDFCSRGEKK